MTNCSQEHNLCIADLIAELIDKGFECYLEFEITISGRHKAVVDLCALKENEPPLLIEAGYLSQCHRGDRMKLLKSLMPTARILHVTQLKNFIPSQDWDYARFAWVRQKAAFHGIC